MLQGSSYCALLNLLLLENTTGLEGVGNISHVNPKGPDTLTAKANKPKTCATPWYRICWRAEACLLDKGLYCKKKVCVGIEFPLVAIPILHRKHQDVVAAHKLLQTMTLLEAKLITSQLLWHQDLSKTLAWSRIKDCKLLQHMFKDHVAQPRSPWVSTHSNNVWKSKGSTIPGNPKSVRKARFQGLSSFGPGSKELL